MGNVASRLKTNNGHVVKDKVRNESSAFGNLDSILEESGDEENLYQ
jgi:hypothetical protein